MAELGDNGFFLEEQVVAVPDPAPPVASEDLFGAPAAAAVPQDNGYDAHDADFFSSSDPSAEAPPSSAPIVQAPLDFDDPRIAWSRNNQGVLQEKDQAEAAGKQELLDKAKAYLDKVAEARNVQLAKRKDTNREQEKLAGVSEGAVPKGDKPWDRVMSVVNFNSEGLSKDPFKEMSRYKTVLLACKSKDIPVN